MDILAHSLWAAALFSALNLNKKIRNKTKEKFSIFKAILWGIFPDLFAFTIPFMFVISGIIFGWITPSTFHSESSAQMIFSQLSPLFNLTMILYNIGHSIVIFLAVFLIAYLIFKKPIWILGGWLLHILIDIPTHGGTAWSTPFLWPLSNFRLDGISWWQNPWIFLLNYVLILAIWIIIVIKQRKMKR
jgi:hypothetical protein